MNGQLDTGQRTIVWLGPSLNNHEVIKVTEIVGSEAGK